MINRNRVDGGKRTDMIEREKNSFQKKGPHLLANLNKNAKISEATAQ